MADKHDSGRGQDRAGRIPPLVGLPGETAGEAVARALRQRKLAQQRSAAGQDDLELPATTEDCHAT